MRIYLHSGYFFLNVVTSVVANRGYMRIYLHSRYSFEILSPLSLLILDIYYIIIYLHRGRAEPRDPDQEITKSERLHWQLVDHDFLIICCQLIQSELIVIIIFIARVQSLLLTPYILFKQSKEKNYSPPAPGSTNRKNKNHSPWHRFSRPGTVMEVDNRWWRTELNSAGLRTFEIIQIKHNIRQIEHAFYQISNTCAYRIRK